MAFAGRCGVEVELPTRRGGAAVAALFAEELGAVLQVRAADVARVLAVLREAGLGDCARADRARGDARTACTIRDAGGEVLAATRTELRARVVRDQLPHAVAARQPGLRARGIRARHATRRPGPVRAA